MPPLPVLPDVDRPVRPVLTRPGELGARLWALWVAATPGVKIGQVIEAPTPEVLDNAKARLQSLGISDLGAVGSITLTQDLVAQPGLISPPGFAADGVAFRDSAEMANLDAAFGAVGDWVQTESVLVADSLDLSNKTIHISVDAVSHFWLIVRRLRCNPGARITFTPTVNPRVVAGGPNGGPSPAEPNFDPNARQASSGHYAANGGDGAQGADGYGGVPGINAPNVTIVALEIDAMPDVIIPGQQGGRGGAGGRGADGGAGQRGRDSHPIFVDCKWGPGFGGNGGTGGNGGRGGRGGRGGKGGDVTMVTQRSQLDRLVTTRPFVLNNGPGAGGDPGPQGDPGNGGPPGAPGHNSGFPCRDEPSRHGAVGSVGQRTGDLGRGDAGVTGYVHYTVITPEQFELTLERPWISSLTPVAGVAGEHVHVKGLHFVPNSQVVFGGRTLPAIFDHAGQLRFDVPGDVPGGRQSVQVRTPDGDLSQPAVFTVRPTLTSVRGSGPAGEVAAGDTVTVRGASFMSDAVVLADGASLVTRYGSPTSLTAVLPSRVGLDPGGQTSFVVQNGDGQRTDPVTVTRLPVLDSGFRSDPDGYSFPNFSDGMPDWSDYVTTFGAAEITANAILNPALTGAYFLFYLWFLNNNGHCSAFASTSLQSYHQGSSGLFASPAHQAPISRPLMHRIDSVQGRMLSKELIVHYAEQSRVGIDRVEQSVRELEADMLDGMAEPTARVLCFIPSGDVWAMLADPAVRSAWMSSHCVVPTRIVYPDAARSLNGARMFIYDNNSPGFDRVIQLAESGGKLGFDYGAVTSGNGFTLGTGTLQQMLHDDVSLPFSGPSAGLALSAFAIDVLMSPARLRIESATNRLIGWDGEAVRTNPAIGYVCPFADNLILTKPSTTARRRRILGYDDGTYTYASVSPAGRSVTIKDAACSDKTDDLVEIDKSYANVSVTPSEAKDLDLHFAQRSGDDVRYIHVEMAVPEGSPTKLAVRRLLDGVQLDAPDQPTPVNLTVRRYRGSETVEEGTASATIPANGRLRLPAGMWKSLATVKPEVD